MREEIGLEERRHDLERRGDVPPAVYAPKAVVLMLTSSSPVSS
jgi:hypothetical protein